MRAALKHECFLPSQLSWWSALLSCTRLMGRVCITLVQTFHYTAAALGGVARARPTLARPTCYSPAYRPKGAFSRLAVAAAPSHCHC